MSVHVTFSCVYEKNKENRKLAFNSLHADYIQISVGSRTRLRWEVRYRAPKSDSCLAAIRTNAPYLLKQSTVIENANFTRTNM